MLAEEKLHDLIEAALFRRVDAVKVDKKGNLLNKAVLSEGFYRGFLNILFDCKLVNANSIKQNYHGVDLIDFNKHIAVQVSTKCDHDKIQHSIDEFDNPDGCKWHFYFLAIENNAPKKRADFELPEWLAFDKNDDVLDTARLMQLVQGILGDTAKETKLRDYVTEKDLRDKVCGTLLSVLKKTRESHPSFRLMGADPIDEMLFPHAKDEELVPALGEAYGNVAPIWEHIKAEHREGFRHIIIEGDGGIGKSVSLLSVTDDAELLALIPAIYIHMYDLVSGESCLTPGEFINKYISDHAAIDELAGIPGEPKLMLLLDGLNEVAYSLQFKLMEGIKTWSEGHPGAQLIVASRPIPGRQLDLVLGDNALHIALQPIGREQAAERLRARGVEPPEQGAKIWESLKLPLFLNLYAKTANLRQTTDSGYPLYVRERTGPASLIWNYTQRELLRGTDEDWPVLCAFACEWIAPYIAYQMSKENSFDLDKKKAKAWVKEAIELINPDALPKHLESIKETFEDIKDEDFSLPDIKWGQFVFKQSGLFVKNKKTNTKETESRYSFIHQTFRDYLAGAYLVGLAEAASDTLPGAWQTTVPHLALDNAAELMDEETADTLWKINHDSQQYEVPGCKTNTTATYLQLELRDRMQKNFEPDFSGMDLSDMSLIRYMGKKETGVRCLFRDPGKTKGAFIGRKTFRSDGHTLPVECVCVLPDGRIVSGSYDNTLRIWDANTGECKKTLEGHTGPVHCVSVLPDGRIVSGSWDNTLRVWNADTGECLKTLEGHTVSVSCISVLRDGRIVSGSWDNTLRVWNADTGECLVTLEGHTGWVSRISVLPDGRIVSGSFDHTLRIWDADTGECLATLEGHTNRVSCISVLPDGRIVSGSDDRTLRVWNAETGECLKTLVGHTNGVNCISVLPDGRIVSGSFDRTLRIWDADTGECLKTLEGHTGPVNCISALRDGRIVSGSWDNALRVWNADTGECLKTLKGHTGWVNCISVLPDGRIVSGSEDRTLRVWNADTGECLKTLEGHTGWVSFISVLPDGRIVSGSEDRTLRIWNADTGECLKTLEGHTGPVNCVSVLPDGRIVSGSDDITLRVWNADAGECLKTLKGHTRSVRCVSVLPDGRIVSGSYDSTLRIWDANTGECKKTLEGHTGWVNCVSVLPNGRIVSGSYDETLRVWNADTRECLKTLEGHTNRVSCISVLPDGRIVSGSGDHTLRVWNADTGECLKTLERHTGSVECVSVLPDGRIVSGSGDRTLRIWDTDTGKCKKTLRGNTGSIRCVSVLSDGRIVSGSNDRTIRIWNAKTGKCLDVLEATEADVSEMDFSLAEFADDGIKKLLRQNRAKV